MKLLRTIFVFIASMSFARHTHAIAIIVDGTSSSGKSSMTSEYIATYNPSAILLQPDAEVINVIIEELQKGGYCFKGSSSDFTAWFNGLPRDVTDQYYDKDHVVFSEELFHKAFQRMIEKTKEFAARGTDVIIEMALYADECAFFKTSLKDLTPKPLLVYTHASGEKLLSNIIQRNSTADSIEKRPYLLPFSLAFDHQLKKDSVGAPETIDTLTKTQFLDLCAHIKNVIKPEEILHLEEFKRKIDHDFFGSEDTIGLALQYPHDHVLNTTYAANPREAAHALHTLIESVRP